MNDYIIMTDSSCDLPASMAKEHGIEVVCLTVRMDDREFRNDLEWSAMPYHDFYDALRGGSVAATSAPSVDDFISVMEPALKAGRDVFYLGFSSALSSTFNTGCIAANMMRAEYPDRKIITLDTLAASLGQGLLVVLTAEQKKAGKTIEEAEQFAKDNMFRMCHWFTVGDLMYLKRGGRISSATAAIGSMLNIKPVLHTDNEGRLTPVTKVRGAKAFYAKIAELMRTTGVDIEKQTVLIVHGDCDGEVEKIKAYITAEFGITSFIVNPMGPVIGAHAGPDTVGIFFIGTER